MICNKKIIETQDSLGHNFGLLPQRFRLKYAPAPVHPNMTMIPLYPAQNICLTVNATISPTFPPFLLLSLFSLFAPLSFSSSLAFWAAAPKGRCPVEHRGEFRNVRPSIRLSVLPSVPPIEHQISSPGLQISPPGLQISPLRPQFSFQGLKSALLA